MKLVQVGVQSLRAPNGDFLPSEPIYTQIPDSEAPKIAMRENEMFDYGASVIAKSMKRYIEKFHTENEE